MLGAGHRDTLGHVDAPLLRLLLAVEEDVLVVVQVEQGEVVQGDLQGSLLVQRVPLDAAVRKDRAGHLRWGAVVQKSQRRVRKNEEPGEKKEKE